ncbi:MAG: DUF4810 domain-containing protein [Opitutaceae bacterium]|nr:DUF4810 domain-containing protein [Opitutaceae bacterium]
MRKLLFATFAALVVGLFGGCVTQKPPLYYYGTYPRTLYNSKKNPSPESVAKHQASIEDVIKVSKAKNLRVPPGIHCEYGYLLWQKGQKADAETQFNLEVTIYPESAAFMTLVLKTLKNEPAT